MTKERQRRGALTALPGKIQQSSSLQLLYWSIVEGFRGGGGLIDFPLMIVVAGKVRWAGGGVRCKAPQPNAPSLDHCNAILLKEERLVAVKHQMKGTNTWN